MGRSLVFILLILFTSCHAEGETKPLYHLHQLSLGTSIILIREYIGEPVSDIVFIQLHHDEQTAVSSAMETVAQNGGKFISIENEGRRNISFNLNGENYRFDPNRIFSENGRKASLEAFRNYSLAASNEVKKLADFIISLVPRDAVIIAIHNNTNDKFSLLDYKKEKASDAREVYRNESLDTDDFVFTTDEEIYSLMVEKKLNVVLQDNASANDDGSLSVFLGRQGRRYINIEAEHGHTKEQKRMVSAVIQALQN